ncbi:hypothetical protein TG4357_02810 [Thalassovita gelatinovora]|uniref:DUF2202 domain-containing protein n=1 Tax=Thalassovita gelatinovora TaxID=53501 RepID=A0A0N7LVS3_THAGE|nr:DUF2202 domain-containing protein [Thalassovita gelatinovora]QIZ81816.1 DUF2202 domain-containing protein [Thalassovita gelatinovora]CUH67098.1 hypothetical protein TG4357_02810 [Thalassovita gelatinovora]SEP80651.1 hypothetical protein SAMN04488043_101450 [Thalassovita gelatinovora]
MVKAKFQYQYGKDFGGGAGRSSNQIEQIEDTSLQTVSVIYDSETTVKSLFADKNAGAMGFWTGGTDRHTVSASYSDEAISELIFMIEEEKLAGDVYEAFYDLYGLSIFSNIAASEDQHFNALINQAERIGLDVDEFIYEESGTFADAELQDMYDTLILQGSESVTAALEVGMAIEKKDIVDIADAADAVEGTALANVYENLLAGSANHLEAFQDALLLA